MEDTMEFDAATPADQGELIRRFARRLGQSNEGATAAACVMLVHDVYAYGGRAAVPASSTEGVREVHSDRPAPLKRRGPPVTGQATMEVAPFTGDRFNLPADVDELLKYADCDGSGPVETSSMTAQQLLKVVSASLGTLSLVLERREMKPAEGVKYREQLDAAQEAVEKAANLVNVGVRELATLVVRGGVLRELTRPTVKKGDRGDVVTRRIASGPVTDDTEADTDTDTGADTETDTGGKDAAEGQSESPVASQAGTDSGTDNGTDNGSATKPRRKGRGWTEAQKKEAGERAAKRWQDRKRGEAALRNGNGRR